MFQELFEEIRRVDEAVDYSIIDEEIRDLVKHLNTLGFRTLSSCSGHFHESQSLATTIAFQAPISKVEKLRMAMNKLSLNLDWEIVGRHPESNVFDLQLKHGFYGDRSLDSSEENVKFAYEDIREIDKMLGSLDIWKRNNNDRR